MDYIKSPTNYIGGKYKLLPQIMPLFPSNIDNFVDLFAGGFNVGINTKANRIIANDVCTQIVDLYKYIQSNKLNHCIDKIKTLIKKYILFL